MKGYKEIREGLLALMCVGDQIYHIRTRTSSKFRTNISEVFYEVFKYKIIAIEEDYITVALYNNMTSVYFDSIHVHNGELYIWRPPLKYYTLNEDEKIEMLDEVLKREDTNHYD